MSFVMSATAVDTAGCTTTTRYNLPDGGYILEEVTELSNATRASGTKSGEKTSVRYTADNQAVYGVKVTGTFNYTGSSSTAIYSAATVSIYKTGASAVSKSARYSGNTAYATGTVKYLGISETRTAALSCDKNGNLS